MGPDISEFRSTTRRHTSSSSTCNCRSSSVPTLLSIGYVGELGRHAEIWRLPENQATNLLYAATPPLTLGGTDSSGILPGFPYLKTLGLTEANNWGTTAYNGLQTSFVRRFNKGLTVNVNYTWSTRCPTSTATLACRHISPRRRPASLIPPTARGASAPRNVFGFQQYAWGNDLLDTPIASPGALTISSRSASP